MKLTKSNILIVEFMGWESAIVTQNSKLYAWWCFSPYNYFPESVTGEYYFTNEWTLDTLHFHTSWDWLMPVVEKIESLDISFDINHTMCYVESEDQSFVLNQTYIDGYKTKLDATYAAVIKFIKWYNKN